MLDTICDVMKAAYDKKWISTRDGNASFKRKNENFLYVTPSGVRKYHMNAEMLIKLKLEVNPDEKFGVSVTRVVDEYQEKIIGLQPTGELPLHILLQKNLPENRVVLHLHPTYIIAAMYAGLNLQQLAIQFPEINRYTRVGPTVPVLPPISEELAEGAIKALNLNEVTGEIDFDIIGLEQHGIIVIAKDAWSALEHVERVESICQVVLAAGKDAYIQHYVS
jgi:ribulose-5-phosphate 4-epimerase/fuculose-1-phosphate aldolase